MYRCDLDGPRNVWPIHTPEFRSTEKSEVFIDVLMEWLSEAYLNLNGITYLHSIEALRGVDLATEFRSTKNRIKAVWDACGAVLSENVITVTKGSARHKSV